MKENTGVLTSGGVGIIPLLGAQGVLRVGGGRGFVAESADSDLVVVTAAHCLPRLPPPYMASCTEERTFASILGPLGGPVEVWAECIFADPIMDIAVLASPDNQELFEQADAFAALVASAQPFGVADAPQEEITKEARVRAPGRGPALVLALDDAWRACIVERLGHVLWLEDAGLIEGGMSGSPIVSPAGHAIGVCSTNTMNPVLLDALPPRLGLRRRSRRMTHKLLEAAHAE